MFKVLKNLVTRKESDDEMRDRILELSYSDDDYGIIAPPIDNGTALNELCRFFLGDDWYSVGAIHNEQVNTEMLYEIERRYSKYVRKELGIR